MTGWDDDFRREFVHLLRLRRDVRRFRTDPLPPGTIERLVELACLAPSVGYSQPWRFVQVDDPARRTRIRDSFTRCNAAALAAQDADRAGLYARLKLAGLDRAPVQMAVFCDQGAATGHGLGRRSMPEMLPYSVVTAVHTLWLAARTEGIGVGWVSILDPGEVTDALAVPASWQLVAYLCIGYPETESDTPELARLGWERPLPAGDLLVRR